MEMKLIVILMMKMGHFFAFVHFFLVKTLMIGFFSWLKIGLFDYSKTTVIILVVVALVNVYIYTRVNVVVIHA